MMKDSWRKKFWREMELLFSFLLQHQVLSVYRKCTWTDVLLRCDLETDNQIEHNQSFGMDIISTPAWSHLEAFTTICLSLQLDMALSPSLNCTSMMAPKASPRSSRGLRRTRYGTALCSLASPSYSVFLSLASIPRTEWCLSSRQPEKHK